MSANAIAASRVHRTALMVKMTYMPSLPTYLLIAWAGNQPEP